METLTADMASMMTSRKSASSLMDVVGADVNSSYDRSMQYQIVSDTFHISTGGQANIGGNVGIQIQLRDDNALHYLKRSGIAFDADVTGFAHNAAMFFTGLELSIGNVVVSTPFQHYYVQQRISKMGKKRLEKYANGICLQLDQNAAPITNLNGGLRRTLFNQAADGGGPVAGAITGSIGALNNEYASLHRELQTYWAERQENGNVVKCFVPFHMIFPAIDDLPDDGCAFTGYGQTIKMNLRTNIPADFVCQVGGGAAPAFALSNMVLVKCFSKLDQPRADLVLKSNITFPLCKYVHWQQQITTNVVNALFSVQRSELIRGLWFAFHTRIQGDATAEATNILANLGNNAAAQFKNPLSYFIQAPIQQIDLLIGGEPVVINLQQIQLLHITDDAFADGKPTYHDPRLRGIKHAYFLDLRRFSKDLFGSSAKQTTTVQVQITLKTGAGSRTIKGQPGDWAIAPAEAANAMGLDRFAFFSYLETMSFMDLKGGQYTSA